MPSVNNLLRAIQKRRLERKFALDPPPDCADYELRVGDFRVLYRVEQEGETIRVIVALIGKKERNKLIVEGEVFEL